MKKLLIILITISAIQVQGQWDKNGGIIFCKWGYQGGKSTVGNFFYQTNPGSADGQTTSPIMIASKDMTYKNKAVFCEIEMINPKLIFGMRFGWGLKKSVADIQGLTVRDGTYFNAYFGYGFPIKKHLSVIPTLRYNYTVFNVEGAPVTNDVTPNYYEEIGGNQRGFGLNVVVPVGEKLLIRSGYYYEWIFRKSKQYKGLAKTPEVELYLPFDDDHTFGLAFKIALPNRKMYNNFSVNNTSVFQPESVTKGFHWELSASIPLPSASTTTYVITVVE